MTDAQLRLDDAQVALRQRREAAKAEALIKTFFRELSAPNTLDLSVIREAERFPEKRIYRQTLVPERERVRNRLLVGCDHFSQITTQHFHTSLLRRLAWEI